MTRLCWCSRRLVKLTLAFATVKSKDGKEDVPICSMTCLQNYCALETLNRKIREKGNGK